jgi:hypothetical protein
MKKMCRLVDQMAEMMYKFIEFHVRTEIVDLKPN